jgi:hypothetical protein
VSQARLTSAVSTAFDRVLFSPEKVQRHVRLIANDAAIVRHRRNVKQIACVKFDYATIIERNGRGSRENKPDVFNGTSRRANARADVLAPFPPRLIRRTTNCDSAEVDQLKFPFLHHAHFIRSVERFQNDCYLLAVHPPLNIENLLLKIKSNFSHLSFMDWEKRFETRRFGAGKIKVARKSWVIVRVRLPPVSGVILFPVKMKLHS